VEKRKALPMAHATGATFPPPPLSPSRGCRVTGSGIIPPSSSSPGLLISCGGSNPKPTKSSEGPEP
jgi:hypothetical protein